MKKSLIVYDAEVASREDPLRLYRIRFRSSHLLGGQEHPEWASSFLASPDWSGPIPPQPGGKVRILLEDGNPNRPWWMPANINLESSIPAEVEDYYPDVCWVRAGGGLIILSDKGGRKIVKMMNQNGYGVACKDQRTYLGLVLNDEALAGALQAAIYIGGGYSTGSTSVFITG